MKKLYLSLMAAAMAIGSTFAQEREMYFSFGEENIDNGAEVTYYGGDEQFCPFIFKQGFIANIIAHVDTKINGDQAYVLLTAYDKQEAAMHFADDEEISVLPTTLSGNDYKVSLKFRALPGMKKEIKLICPTDPGNTAGGFKHSYRMQLDIQRIAGDGSNPDDLETIESVIVILSNNPADVDFNDPGDDPVDPPVDPGDDPVDPPVDPGDDPDDPTPGAVAGVLSDANPVLAVGNMLYYKLNAPEAVDVYSVSGAHVYGGEAGVDGATDLGFLPAGLYLYKVGNHTGKIMVK